MSFSEIVSNLNENIEEESSPEEVSTKSGNPKRPEGEQLSEDEPVKEGQINSLKNPIEFLKNRPSIVGPVRSM